MAIELLKINMGVTEIVIKDCLTMERGTPFLNECLKNNSFPEKIKYKLHDTYGNTKHNEEKETA
jgi:hypothetical protein